MSDVQSGEDTQPIQAGTLAGGAGSRQGDEAPEEQEPVFFRLTLKRHGIHLRDIFRKIREARRLH